MVAVAWNVLTDRIVAFGAVAAAIGACYRFLILPPYRFAKRVEASMAFVENEMRPNGGGSLRDQIDILRADAEATRTEFVTRGTRIEALENRLDITDKGLTT